MSSLRFLMLAFVLACAAPAALAQQSLQQQMTAEEFRAAGLDKLSAGELASLDRWLQRQVEEETIVAAEHAREEARQEAEAAAVGRSGSDREVIQSTIVGEFKGFGRRFRYTLANGQVWEQTDASRLDGVRLTDPAVTINPGIMGAWFLRIDGYNTRAKVKRVD